MIGKNIKRKDTLCWSCKRTDCPWMQNFIPINGWKATPTRIKNAHFKEIDSFIVHECPKFEKFD